MRKFYSILMLITVMLCVGVGSVWADNYLKGTFNSWGTTHKFVDNKVVIELAANTTYEFKIVVGDTWYGNNGTMTSEYNQGWIFSNSESTNCKITTTRAGKYLFTFDEDSKKLSVSYPEYYLPGTWNDNFAVNSNVQFVENKVTLHLSANTTYSFKFYNANANTWSGNSGTMTSNNCTGCKFIEDANCGFKTLVEGDYTFTLSWDNTIPVISASYPSTTISISAVGYATYFNSEHAYIMPAETEGYVAYLDGSFKFEKAYNAGDVVPAATPLVLKGSGEKTLTYTTGGSAPTKNDLIGTATALTATDMTSANTGKDEFFALSRNKAQTSVGFYWVTETGSAFAIGAGKAYLAYSTSQLAGITSAKGFSFDDAEASGIASVEATENNAPAYNIAGQRVNANAKGIVIINGKKYFNK